MVLTKKQRSNIVKRAMSGKGLGEAGKLFDKVKKKAEKFYKDKGKAASKSKEIARKVAAKVMWTKLSK